MAINDKIEEAQTILRDLELPSLQQNRICALTLLALANIKPGDSWESATANSMTLSKDIIEFVNNYYHADYKPSTRESFRKNALRPFVENNIAVLNPDDPDLTPTSSRTHYSLSYIALNAIKKFKSSEWTLAKDNFLRYANQRPSLQQNPIFLKTIHIVNYKSIADDKIELGRFNVFIGVNGCGKTNILEAVATVGAERGNDLTYDGLASRGVRIARPDLMISSFLSGSAQSSIDINLSFSQDEKDDLYKCSLAPVNPRDVYSKWINLREEESYGDVLLEYFKKITTEQPGISGQQLMDKANELIAVRGLRKDYSFDNLLSEYAIFDINTRSLRGIASVDSKKTPLGINGEGLDLLIATFNQNERTLLNHCFNFFDWLAEIVADKDDKLKPLGLKPGRSISTLYFKDKFMQKENNTFSAENSNEGILHVLFYLALFISSKTPRIFAIDNIETALNPRLCQALVKELVSLAEKTNKQALITTQNPAILDGLNLLDEEQRLFEVSRDQNGKTRTRRIKFKSDLSDKQFKLSEMWLKGVLGAVPNNF